MRCMVNLKYFRICGKLFGIDLLVDPLINIGAHLYMIMQA